MLSINNLSFFRGTTSIFRDLTYTFEPGSITCIVGPSGVGKSTLLSCLTQLITSYEGSITLEGIDLKTCSTQERARLVGMVFQDLNLFPMLTAQENIAQPLQIVAGLSQEEASSKAETLLDTFGMLSYKDAYSAHLSGGQQQRIALARALGLQPKALCLDEPTSALDKGSTELLVAELTRLKQEGMTLIITSHDSTFVKRCADTTLHLENDCFA